MPLKKAPVSSCLRELAEDVRHENKSIDFIIPAVREGETDRLQGGVKLG